MGSHLNTWKKALIIYLAEIFIFPILFLLIYGLGEAGRTFILTLTFGVIGIWHGDVSGIIGIIPFILNGIFALTSKDINIKWRIFYLVVFGLIIWPLVLLTIALVGKQFGLLNSY